MRRSSAVVKNPARNRLRRATAGKSVEVHAAGIWREIQELQLLVGDAERHLRPVAARISANLKWHRFHESHRGLSDVEVVDAILGKILTAPQLGKMSDNLSACDCSQTQMQHP